MEGKGTHLARSKRLLYLGHFAPIISPTQWAEKPRPYYKVRLEKRSIDDLRTQDKLFGRERQKWRIRDPTKRVT
jgi:hypothetical protein